MPVTRTLNPLPFHDLEPKRFEDLVRQLIYDFRPWLRLEATGRAGGDEGYDARAIERVDASDDSPELNSDDTDEPVSPPVGRPWLIQCKRERKIGPTKVQQYLDEIRPDAGQNLYGLIFAACCDFSKKSRDVVAAWCRQNGLSEFQVWSVSDIETMLMQPKNDHILFAFFGISLQIRQRSKISELRSLTALKRKISRLVEKRSFSHMLIRNLAEDANFPYVEKGEYPKWLVRQQTGFDFRGLGFQFRRHISYIGENEQWDMADECNEEIDEHSNPWARMERGFITEEIRKELYEFVQTIPVERRAILTVQGFIPFSAIAWIDEVGDLVDTTYHSRPIIFAQFEGRVPVVHPRVDVEFRPQDSSIEGFYPDKRKRIAFFPEKFRRPADDQ